MAYYNVASCGPAFGSEDLQLLDSYGECKCQHDDFLIGFEGLHGNTLCGGIEYEKEDKDKLYQFKIQKMNSFAMEIHQDCQ